MRHLPTDIVGVYQTEHKKLTISYSDCVHNTACDTYLLIKHLCTVTNRAQDAYFLI